VIICEEKKRNKDMIEVEKNLTLSRFPIQARAMYYGIFERTH